MIIDCSSTIYTGSAWHSEKWPPSRVKRMHYSLGGAGLGHISVSRVLSVRGSGRVCPISSGSRSRFALTGILEPQGVVPQALNLLGGVRFIAWRLRRPFLGNADGARGIFENAGGVWATALRPDPPKKNLVPYSSGWWDGRQLPITSKLPDITGRTLLTVE